MHYRIANLPDRILETIAESARHALTHTDIVRRDTERLQKRTGCCVPAALERTEPACCGVAEQRA